MPTMSDTTSTEPTVTAVAEEGGGQRLVEDDLLVEDISIDSMCGVY